MESYTNFFELHVGFPAQDHTSADTVRLFLADMRRANSTDWVISTVRSMYPDGDPTSLDPHNVPGRLGWLVSRKIFQVDRSWDVTRDTVVLPACEQALERLSRMGATDARLEIEFPFGYFSSVADEGTVSRSTSAVEPVSIPDDKLRFPFGTTNEKADPVRIPSCHLTFHNGTRMRAVPAWEIHFVLEQTPAFGRAAPLDVSEVGAFLQGYGLNIEQTIEYRSASMELNQRDDCRLIATAYYDTQATVETEARRVFYRTPLCQDAMQRGYNVRLILEHIVACIKPLPFQRQSSGTQPPVTLECSR